MVRKVRIVIGRNMHFNETVANHLALRVVRRLREMDFNVEDVPRRLEPDERKRLKGLLAKFKRLKGTDAASARQVSYRIKDVLYPLTPSPSADKLHLELREAAHSPDTLVYDFHNANRRALPRGHAARLRKLATSQDWRYHQPSLRILRDDIDYVKPITLQEWRERLRRDKKQFGSKSRSPHPVFTILDRDAPGGSFKTIEILCAGKPILKVPTDLYGESNEYFSDFDKTREAGVDLDALEEHLVRAIAADAEKHEQTLAKSGKGNRP